MASRQTYIFEILVLTFKTLKIADWETGIDTVLFGHNNFAILNDYGFAFLIPNDFEFISDIIHGFLLVLVQIPGHDGFKIFRLTDDYCNDRRLTSRSHIIDLGLTNITFVFFSSLEVYFFLFTFF